MVKIKAAYIQFLKRKEIHMSTSKIKKQNRVLYICLIILLVTASVLVAITSASNKSEKKETTEKQTESMENTDKLPQMATPEETESDKPKDAGITEESDGEKEEDDENDSKSGQVSANPEEISFVAPVNGEISNPHSLTVPVFSATMNDYRTHAGVDIAAQSGAEVYSCADGTIEDVWEDPMMGYCIKVAHTEDIASIYKNLSAELPDGIEKGAAVSAGQVIACVGDTALVECEDDPHLHFELTVAGESVDPAEYIEMKSLNSTYEDE